MNNSEVLNHKQFGRIRIIEEDGQVLFCGVDVARALGYSNPSDAVTRHCRWVVKRDVPHPQSPGKTMEMNFITEGDLYRITAASELTTAAAFESWIFDEVLPSIRRTGAYVVNTCPHPPQHTGEVARYIKVVAGYMEKQGSPPFEILQMILDVSAQHGIRLPQSAIKPVSTQLTFYQEPNY